jgi:hypothetical protein
MRRLLLLAVSIMALGAEAALYANSGPSQVASSSPETSKAGKRASTPAGGRSTAFAATLRSRIAQSIPVKAVRFTPRSGLLRVTTEDSVLRQATYESVLAITCNEIVSAKQLNAVAAIEVLNATARQGYVYQTIWKCGDIAKAPTEKLRLMLLPGTRVFRPRP